MFRYLSAIIISFYILPCSGQYIVSHYTFDDNDGQESLIFVDVNECRIADTIPFPLPTTGITNSDIDLAMRGDSLIVIGDIYGNLAQYRFNGLGFDLISPPYRFRPSDGQLPIQSFAFLGDWLYFNRNESIFRYHLELQVLEQVYIKSSTSDFIVGFAFHKDSVFIQEVILMQHRQLYKADLGFSSKVLVMDSLSIFDEIQLSGSINSIQYNCERVELISWGELNRYLHLDYESDIVTEVCIDVTEESTAISQGDGLNWGYPLWSDCKLSIDLDLSDELYQFNRDYAQIPCGHTDIALSDEDVQVFASGGSIDSIVVEILEAELTQYILATANGNVQVSGDGTSHLVLVANDKSRFDDYENVIRSLRYMDDGPFNADIKEISFRAYVEGVHGIITTSRLDIQSEEAYAGRDTIIELCAENNILDLDLYLDSEISSSGTWINGDGFVDLSEQQESVFYYEVNSIGCGSDTSAIYIIVSKEINYNIIDTSLCEGEAFILGENDFSGMSTVVVGTLGQACDSIYTTYYVNVESLQSVYVDTVLCNEESLWIDELEFDSTGTYQEVLVSENNCDSIIYNVQVLIDTYEIDDTLQYQFFDIEANTTTSIELEIPEGFSVFQWFPDIGLNCLHCQTVEVQLNQNNLYEVEIISLNGCSEFIEVEIEVYSDLVRDEEFYLPNIIDPRDVSNNTFGLYTSSDVKIIYDMYIFDRWGNSVFEEKGLSSQDNDRGWNGTGKDGKYLEQGVYVYKIIIQNGEEEVVYGDVLKM